MGDERSDALLVRAARGGDRPAFASLIERHWPLLVGLCRRTLGIADLAEDAAQEAVLQAMLGLASLRQPEAFGSWLAGIGLNVCRRLLRASHSPTVLSWDTLVGGRLAALPDVADRQPSPEEVVEAAEVGVRVREAVDALPSGQRSAVLLFYLAGHTHQEVAVALGIQVGAVKTRLNKARRSLRRRLAPLWSEAATGDREPEQTKPPEVEKMAEAESRSRMARVVDVRRIPAEGDTPAQHVVLLEEVDGGRQLPIWIGEWEAMAMAMSLTSRQPPRPLTYSLAATLLQEVGASVRRVEITRLAENVFYASIDVVGPEGLTGSADARPSDALNLALVSGAPIEVDASVFEAVANPPTPPPYPMRDPYGPETKGAGEMLTDAMATWPNLPTIPPSP